MTQYVDPRPLFEPHLSKPLSELPAELDPWVLEVGGILEAQRRRQLDSVRGAMELLQRLPVPDWQAQLQALEQDSARLPTEIRTAVIAAVRCPGQAEFAEEASELLRERRAWLESSSWWERHPFDFGDDTEAEKAAARRTRLDDYDLRNNPNRVGEWRALGESGQRREDLCDELAQAIASLAVWIDVPPGNAHGQEMKEKRVVDLERRIGGLKREFAAPLEGNPVQMPQSNGTDEIHPRTKNTLLVILAALCDEAGIAVHERGTAKRIQESTERIGCPVSDDTILAILRQIPEALEHRR